MKTIFHRLSGHPFEVDEPALTQMLASVLEREPELCKELVRRLLESDAGFASLDFEKVTVHVDAERPISQGGRPDLILEVRDGDAVRASVIIENKLYAPVNNPLAAYLDAVSERRANGQAAVFVLVSKRWAWDDDEVEPYRSDDRFRYLPWSVLYRWIQEASARLDDERHWLLREFLLYLGEMGMNNCGTFTFADIGLAALVPSLLLNMERTLDDQVRRALSGMSFETKLAVKEWKNSEAYSLWSWVVKKPWWVSAGYVFRESPMRDWRQSLRDSRARCWQRSCSARTGRGTIRWSA